MPKGKTRTKTKGRKQGAQPGNKNALRHGFYSRQFTKDENAQLDSQEPTDMKSEIAVLRVCINRLLDQLYFEPVYLPAKDANGAAIQSDIRDDHYLKQLNTLATISQSIATLARTQHLITGKGGEIIDTIEQALEEIRLEMGL